MSVSFNFSGKVVLITGSSAGIGAATAVQFSKAGAQVVVTGRRADKVSEVAKECLKVSPNGTKALQVVADVTKVDDLRRLVDTTIKHFGKLHVLVNNAGAGFPIGIDNKDYYSTYLKTMQLNLNSVVYLTHICVEHLEKTKGNVINISSVAALQSGDGASPYHMSKVAMDMFTKCMAAELGPKRIRVNVINPGPIRTEILNAAGLPQDKIDKHNDYFSGVLPLGRVGDPDDIADSILYLASDHAAFVTGTNLISDGGAIAANAINSKALKEVLFQ
ncbi:unnamed protein product [Oppiella nova]|uniref:Ketoreductase domain-containing protein n=1 Tax=Oppiella nova TaxID=334625 RepID=A0A7R9QJB1_9ACAR|nr:unnamed protein product [Oppiella nova]CAG2166481.1 unnamed protein product [Oppiella nova]